MTQGVYVLYLHGRAAPDAVCALGRSYFPYYNVTLTFQVLAALAPCLSCMQSMGRPTFLKEALSHVLYVHCCFLSLACEA